MTDTTAPALDARHVPGDSAVVADMMLSLAHDEDGDGIPDADDPCPHVAGTTADGDGDGVGDDCDVNPGTPSEHWALFSTMQAGDEPFDDITGFAQEADALRVATDVGPNVNISFVRARIDVGWTINAVIGTGHLSLELGGPRQFGPHGPDPEFDRKAVEWIANGDLEGCLSQVTLDSLWTPGNATHGFMDFMLMMGVAGENAKADYVDTLDLFHTMEAYFTWYPNGAPA